LVETPKLAIGRKFATIRAMPAKKPVALPRPMKFDEAMRRLVKLPPPPSGKKAQRKIWRKKKR
jgi:hypothetical protein